MTDDRIETLQREVAHLEHIEAGELSIEDEAKLLAHLERLPAARRELHAARLVHRHRHERVQRERREAVAHADRVARLRERLADAERRLATSQSGDGRRWATEDVRVLREELGKLEGETATNAAHAA